MSHSNYGGALAQREEIAKRYCDEANTRLLGAIRRGDKSAVEAWGFLNRRYNAFRLNISIKRRAVSLASRAADDFRIGPRGLGAAYKALADSFTGSKL